MKNRVILAAIAGVLSYLPVLNAFAQDITSTTFNDNGHSVAAGDIVWYGTTLDDAVEKTKAGGYVYLYNVKTGKFLNAGGTYGVHGVLSAVGMRLKVAASTSTGVTGAYTIEGRIDNAAQGDYMSPNGTGNDIYMDRVGTNTTGTKYSQPDWKFTVIAQPTGQSTVNGETKTFTNYRIQNANRGGTTSYLGTQTNDGNNADNVYFVGQNGNNNVWRFVSEADYQKAMDNVTWGSVDLGAFLKDAEFGRDNKDGRYWVWSDAEAPAVIETATDSEGEEYTKDAWDLTSANIHWHQRNQNVMCNGQLLSGNISNALIGKNVTGSTTGNIDLDAYQSSYARYYAAEIYNEKITLSQELEMSNVENLKEGLYKLTAQALYYDDDSGLTNDNAYFFVKTVSVVDGERVEKTQELPIIPMNKVDGNNITPHSGVSAGYVFDNNAQSYLHEFYIELKGETKITLGMRTEKAAGWAVIGNIHLYAHGKQALFLDEDWDEKTSVPYYDETSGKTEWSDGDPYKHTQFYNGYEFPATVYYNRTMTKDVWNPICLPIALTGSQIRATFGADCQLSTFKKLAGKTILFEAVDLDTEGIEICKPYIIKPTKNPDVTNGESINLEVGNGGKTHYVTVDGPVYFIAGVTKEATTTMPVPGKIKDSASGIIFEGNFYHKVICDTENPDGSLNEDNWVISKGEMYHLTNTKKYNVWGTYAYLHAPKDAEAKIDGVAISNKGITTGIDVIEGLFFENIANTYDNNVYTISGQKIATKDSLEGLSKGIYIMNGKKFVVK